MVRQTVFAMQLSDPDDYEGGNVGMLDEAGWLYPRKRGTIVLFDSRTQHRVLKVNKGVSLLLDGLLDPVGSEVEQGGMTELQLMMQERWNRNCLDL